MARKESIQVDVKGADKGARDLDKLGKAADDTAGDFVQLGKSMVPYVAGAKKAEKATDDLGEELDHTAHDAAHLTREIERLTKAQKELGAEFLRTGDQKAFKMGGQVARNIAQLKQMQKLLAPGPKPPDVTGGFAGMLSGLPGLVGPGKAAGAVAGLSALPFLGASAGAVGLLGAGLGAMGGGAAIAANRSDAVQQAFMGLGGKVSDRAGGSATAAFAGPMIKAAKDLDKVFDNVADDLDRIFDKSSKFVGPLTRGLGGFVTNVLPGFEKGLDGAADLVDTLGDHLPRLGDAIGDMFESFDEGSEGANQALDDLLTGIGGLVRGIGAVVEGTSKWYNKAVEFRNINPILRHLYGDDFESKSESVAESGKEALDTLGDASAKNALRVKQLNDRFDELFGIVMSVDEAAIAYQQAIDDLTASFKENGKSLDINTEKGRANREAVNDVIKAIQDQREAAINAAQGSEAAINQANTAYLTQLQNLRAQLVALGLNTTAVDDLIKKYQELAKPLTKHIAVIVTEYGKAPSGRGASSANKVAASAYAHGGMAAADRGLVTNGLFRGGPPLIKFAEPSTGIEALIPKMGIPASRGLALADEAASWHGGRVVPAGGGMGMGGRGEIHVTGSADSAVGQLVMHLVQIGAIQLRVFGNQVKTP